MRNKDVYLKVSLEDTSKDDDFVPFRLFVDEELARWCSRDHIVIVSLNFVFKFSHKVYCSYFGSCTHKIIPWMIMFMVIV